MINHEGVGGFGSGELTANQAVGVLDTLAERIVAVSIVYLICQMCIRDRCCLKASGSQMLRYIRCLSQLLRLRHRRSS